MFKKNKKLNILIILSFTILLIYTLYNTYTFINQTNQNLQKSNEIKELCINRTDASPSEKLCEEILANEDYNPDFYSVFFNTFITSFNNLSIIIFLFITIPVTYYISKYLKNKLILYDLTRYNYKNIIKKLIINSYKPILILPLIAIIIMIISIIYTNNNFDATYAISSNSLIAWNYSTVKKPILFISLYLINLIIHSILYINISLCITRKHHNFFTSTILSFLTLISIEIFLEIVINSLICKILLKNYTIGIIFNIMNIFSFNDTNGILLTMSIPLIIMIISTIILIKLYKNKESLIIDCEKNNQEEA